MNSFLKEHVESVTGGLDITKTEYKILAEQVANRLKGMDLVNAEGYMIKIRKKLSDCFRNARYYPKKQARRAAQRAAKRAALNQTEESEEAEADDTEPQDENAVEPNDEADTILQKPVVNRQSVKMCISRSMTRIGFIKTHSVQEVLGKYPYLNEADLLIYEYSTRVPLPLNKIQDNFARTIPFLSHILNIDLQPDDDDEQGKLMLFKMVEDFFSGGENHLPSIQFCDAANRNAVPLNNIPKGQSPALVVLKDDSKVLLSAALIFDGEVLTTVKHPSAFDCITLLMAGYWVFHLYYPSPYEQHLEIFEAILHDKISEKAREVVRFSKMDEFLRKLTIAMTPSQ